MDASAWYRAFGKACLNPSERFVYLVREMIGKDQKHELPILKRESRELSAWRSAAKTLAACSPKLKASAGGL